MADDLTRPSWWPRFVPARCPDGHILLPGRVASHWVNEPGCPANNPTGNGDPNGHDIWTCETGYCGAEFRPETCSNPVPPRLPASHRQR